MNLYSHSGYRHDRDRTMLPMDYSATPPGSLRNMGPMNNWTQENREDRRASTYSGAGAGHLEGRNERTHGASGFYRGTSAVDKTRGRGAVLWSSNTQNPPARDPDANSYSSMGFNQGRGQMYARRPEQPQHYGSDTGRSEDGTERSEGLADRSAGTRYTVTYVKTFCEMATQTTEDEMGGKASTWNGICVMSVDKQNQNRPPQQQQQQQQLYQPQRPSQQQQFQQQQRAQQPPLRSSASLTPASRSGPAPVSASKSLLNALAEPYLHSPSSATQPTSTSQDPRRASTHEDSWGSSPSSAKDASPAWEKSEETASNPPEVNNWGTPGNTGADGWGSSVATETNNWSNNQTTAAASGASDPWMTPISSVAPVAESVSGGGGVASGWGESPSQKGVGALVDWSTGLVSEFPAEAKPTLMPITEKWNSRADRAFDARNSKNAPKIILQRPSQPPRPQQPSPHPRQLTPPEDKQNTSTAAAAAPAAVDPWLTNAGTGGGSNWGDPPSTADSVGAFPEKDTDDRDDSRSRRSSVQMPHGAAGAGRRQQDVEEQDPGHHRSSQSQERRPLTSEERFMKSLNRVSGGDRQESQYTGSSSGSHHSSQGDRSSYQNGGGSQDGDSGRAHGSNWNGYKSGTAAGYSRPNNQSAGPYQPTSFTASSPSNLTGRRYFNANPDRESATAAWSAAAAASQSSAGRAAAAAGSRNERSEPSNSSSATTAPAEPLEDSGNAQVSRPAAGKPKAAIGGLMTSNDMKSFLMAAKAFEPVSSKVSIRGRRTSHAGSSSRHTSPAGSRNSSVSRQQHQLLEDHDSDEQGHTAQDTPHQQEPIQPQSAEASEPSDPHESEVPNWGTGGVIETERSEMTDWACEDDETGQGLNGSKQDDDHHSETKEDDGAMVKAEKDSDEIQESGTQSPPRSSGERTSAQAMEDNLLSFQTQKRDVSCQMAPESADAQPLDTNDPTPQVAAEVSLNEDHGDGDIGNEGAAADVATDVSNNQAE